MFNSGGIRLSLAGGLLVAIGLIALLFLPDGLGAAAVMIGGVAVIAGFVWTLAGFYIETPPPPPSDDE